MKKPLITFSIGIAIFLGGCGIKERAVNLKNRIAGSELSSPTDEGKSLKLELIGMLLILDPKKCHLVEGCGPNYSLLGRNLESQVSIAGKIQSAHQKLVISAVGEPAPLSVELVGQSGYENVKAHVEIEKYRLRSSIPYYPFLVEQAEHYTTQKFGCSLLWDKSYSWHNDNNGIQLIVKMTNTYSDAPQPWVQLSYDGNTGELVNASMQPQQMNPCEG